MVMVPDVLTKAASNQARGTYAAGSPSVGITSILSVFVFGRANIVPLMMPLHGCLTHEFLHGGSV